jgi:hypothetical protein
MMKPSAKKASPTDSDLRPDAWDRFERAVDFAAQRTPLHKAAKAKKAPSRAKPATRKARKSA